MKKEKLLIISWNLHPWPTGSSVIVNNLVEKLGKDDVVLIGEKHPTLTSTWSNNLPKIHYIDPNFNILGRGQTHLRWFRYLSIEKQVKNIAIQEGVTKILGIFPDDFYIFLAFRLSKILQIPFYTWFHNTYLDNYSGYRKIIASVLQPIVFKSSKKIFVMSDGMKQYLDQKYPNTDFITLEHGFKLPATKTKSFHTLDKNGKIKFLFTGSLNESCRDATVRLIKTILSIPQYEVHLFTGNPIKDFAEYGLISDRLIYHGFVSLDELYNCISDYDIMLLPHGFIGDRTDVEFKTIFPTRTIPLLVSERPILAHSPADTFLTEFLVKNNCAWLVTVENEGTIKETILEIIDNDEMALIKSKNALKTAEIFRIENILKKLNSHLGLTLAE